MATKNESVDTVKDARPVKRVMVSGPLDAELAARFEDYRWTHRKSKAEVVTEAVRALLDNN